MRGSEISAVGVWGVSMSMRVRHGLRARGALVSTPLFEIQALTGGPWASKNARSRSIGKLYLFARKPDHHWHRLGMGRARVPLRACERVVPARRSHGPRLITLHCETPRAAHKAHSSTTEPRGRSHPSFRAGRCSLPVARRESQAATVVGGGVSSVASRRAETQARLFTLFSDLVASHYVHSTRAGRPSRYSEPRLAQVH